MNVLGFEQGLGRRSGKRRRGILARSCVRGCGRGHVLLHATITAWSTCAVRQRARGCRRPVIAAGWRRRSAASAGRATSRLLRERESQLERLERHGRLGAAQSPGDASLRHRTGERLQLTDVILGPGTRRAASRAGGGTGGSGTLGNTGHGVDRSDAW